MVVPHLAARINLHETHAAFHEAPGHETAFTKIIRILPANPVQLACNLSLAGDIERLTGLHLHAGGHLIIGNARIEHWLVRALGFMQAIKGIDEIALGGGDTGRLLVIRLDVQHRRALALDLRALIERRQISAHPVLHIVDRQPVLRIGQHHIGRQILAHAAEAVGYPST